MYSLIDMCILNLSVNHQNLVMVNDFNSFYVLARRLNGKSIEINFFSNLLDTTEVAKKKESI